MSATGYHTGSVNGPTSRYGGFIVAEHRIPFGMQVVEFKQCENCPTPFIRKRCVHPHTLPDGTPYRCDCIKYCGRCQKAMLLPQEPSEEYKALLPVDAERKSTYVHYDHSLMSEKTRREKRTWPRSWGKLLVEEIMKRGGAISAEEICIAFDLRKAQPAPVIYELFKRGFEMKHVGSVWPRVGRGMARKIYGIKRINIATA